VVEIIALEDEAPSKKPKHLNFLNCDEIKIKWQDTWAFAHRWAQMI
jgi:hypothetical protein